MDKVQMAPDWWCLKGFEVRRDGQKRRCALSWLVLSSWGQRSRSDTVLLTSCTTRTSTWRGWCRMFRDSMRSRRARSSESALPASESAGIQTCSKGASLLTRCARQVQAAHPAADARHCALPPRREPRDRPERRLRCYAGHEPRGAAAAQDRAPDDACLSLSRTLSSSSHAADGSALARSQGQAKRLEGVTPASLACLMKYVRNSAARRAELDAAAATALAGSAAVEVGAARLGL